MPILTYHYTDNHGDDGEDKLASRIFGHVVERNLACEYVRGSQTDTLNGPHLSDRCLHIWR